MAYIDDLTSPRPGRRPRLPRPQTADPVVVTYGGPPQPPYVEPRPPVTPPSPGGIPPTSPWGPHGAGGGNAPERPPRPPVVPPPPVPPVVPPPPVAPPVSPDYSRFSGGFDRTKLANTAHNSPKYRLARALAAFDPRQGITSGVVDALNGLGLGRFDRVDDDEVRLTGGNPEWDGLDIFDLIEGYGTGNGLWAYQGRNSALPQGTDPGAPGSASGAGGGAGSTGGGGTSTSGAGGGGAQNGTTLDPVTGRLGGSGGLDFSVDGEYGYDDPNSRQLEEFLRMLIDEKVTPIEDPARNEYANALRQRFASLTDPALTENDRSRLENRALEPMERDRQIRLQQQKERMAAMGHGESSGTIVDALADVDRDFDRRRGEVQRDLSIYDREQDQVQAREAMSVAEAVSNLSGQQRGEREARMREALTYVSLFPEMDERRMRLAMETLGMSNSMANAPSIFNTLSNLQAQANASAQQGQQNNAAFWNQMGQWMASMRPSGGGSGGSGGIGGAFGG